MHLRQSNFGAYLSLYTPNSHLVILKITIWLNPIYYWYNIMYLIAT